MPITPMIAAKSTPLISPAVTSRRITRRAFEPVRSRVASARTATVSDCVAALPPMEATIGIRTASATSAWMVASNCAITSEARIAVIRFTNSHGKRCRTICAVRSLRLSSPRPASRRMSSSVSSSRTAMASSMVMTPESRPPESTTGAEIR